jgi:hypothetical protein
MRRAFLLLAAVSVSLAIAATRADADSVDRFQANGTFLVQFERVDCLAGIPATTNCFHNVSLRAGVFPGLGEVGPGAYTLVWDDFGAPCAHVHGQIPLLVAGKGEIDLAMSFTACFVTDLFPPAAVTVTGGTGRYAGASGSGMLTFSPPTLTGPGAGNRVIAWSGTLDVPGLTFDTTPPEIAGATSKAVKTRLRAGVRVRYAVSAGDATDGPLPAACLPKSGSLFPVGRTTVTCSPVDSSGNAARAQFVITVKRVRR